MNAKSHLTVTFIFLNKLTVPKTVFRYLVIFLLSKMVFITYLTYLYFIISNISKLKKIGLVECYCFIF